MLPGSFCSMVISPSCTRGFTKSCVTPWANCVPAGGVNGVTSGVSAPGNGAAGAPPGGVKIRFGKVSAGHVEGTQLKVCWNTPFSTRTAYQLLLEVLA